MNGLNFPPAITKALDKLCRAYQDKDFVPILEADIAGYLYYVMVKQNEGNSSNIHISGRIPSKEGKRKYPDLVIGNVLGISEQVGSFESWVQSGDTGLSVPKDKALKMVHSKSFQERLKPMTASIEVAVEIKPFLRGFSSQQLWHRMENARADLMSLASKVPAKVRILLIFDEINFLTKTSMETRLDQLIKLRDSLAPEIRIVYVSCTAECGCNWRLI